MLPTHKHLGRRLAIIQVATDLIVRMCTGAIGARRCYELMHDPLPSDAVLVETITSVHHNAVLLLCESKSFSPITDECMDIPMLPPPYFRTYAAEEQLPEYRYDIA